MVGGACGPARPRRCPWALAWGITLQLVAATAAAQPLDDYINPDRPGIADGSNVVGAGRIQLETGLQREYRSSNGVQSRTLFLPTLLRIGLNESIEFRIESNTYTRTTETDSRPWTASAEGIAPVSVGLKYHFIDADGRQQPSVGVIARVFPRSGTRRFQTTRTTGDFRLAADWDFLPEWSLNPNVGVALYEGDDRRLYAAGLFAATLSYSPTKSLSFFIDTGVQYPETKRGRSAIVLDIGIAYLIGRDIQIDISAGSRVAGETPARPFLAVGLSKRF